MGEKFAVRVLLENKEEEKLLVMPKLREVLPLAFAPSWAAN